MTNSDIENSLNLFFLGWGFERLDADDLETRLYLEGDYAGKCYPLTVPLHKTARCRVERETEVAGGDTVLCTFKKYTIPKWISRLPAMVGDSLVSAWATRVILKKFKPVYGRTLGAYFCIPYTWEDVSIYVGVVDGYDKVPDDANEE